jgi:hypothetical protein
MIKERKRFAEGRYRPLKYRDVEKIHETSLMKIFAEVGVQGKN